MAVFDRTSGKLVIRIVYDGPAFAGKTTNLQQLTQVFTPLRRSELLVSETTNGRTLYLDWLRVDGGLIAGNAMSCHLISVPGQAALGERRSHLLGLADVVVFVASSEPERLRDDLTLLRVLQDDAPHLPLVVQANKQDAPGALSPKELRSALSLADATPCIAAQADSGVGVRETMIIAVRTASQGVQRKILDAGLWALEGAVSSGEDLLEELKSRERLASTSRVALVLERHRVRAGIESWPTKGLPQDGTEQASGRASEMKAELVEAPMPTAFVPSGYIWPSATGREILRRIPLEEAELRRDLVGQIGTDDGSGSPDLYLLEAGPWCLKTSVRRRYSDVEVAREQLLTLARKKILLGGLLVKDTVLTLSADDAGNHWLWTVAPWVSTLRSSMTLAVDTGNLGGLEEALATFARVAVEAMQLAARSGIALDVHPSNFASVRERVYYVDDDIGLSNQLPAMGHSLLRRVQEYSPWPSAVESYLNALEKAMRAGLTSVDIETLGLRSSVAEAVTAGETAAAAQRRVLDILEEIGPG